ncbi:MULTISPECIES: hypothetical protein [Chryseobacterium]|uniref:Uncharacterized protein n=1 Tax=Chryseobacterium candidae TaxID=1978493 RepID=A0ABY2R7F1_9FLAO|nr:MULTISPECIES: hypothetical protein [Chryseobacterium]PXW16568.1 hypothetical protein C8D70_10365 [Chryseobacterium sp. CBTAP 102]THV59899.1 hypothetical protein EK417_10645 [Chryseobacterium candidae]
MNWIIRSTKKVKFHTNLQEVLKPIWDDLAIYKWILTDLDFISDQTLPINFDEDYFVLDHPEFELLYQSNTQIIWGIISAVPNNIEPDTSAISILSAEDTSVWESNQFLIPESILEIIAFDSGYTIVKFKDKSLSDQFENYFKEQVIDLQKFNEKYINRT